MLTAVVHHIITLRQSYSTLHSTLMSRRVSFYCGDTYKHSKLNSLQLSCPHNALSPNPHKRSALTAADAQTVDDLLGKIDLSEGAFARMTTKIRSIQAIKVCVSRSYTTSEFFSAVEGLQMESMLLMLTCCSYKGEKGELSLVGS